MAEGQHKSTTNKSQESMILQEASYPTTVSPRYPNTAETQENELKSILMNMAEAFT